MDKYQQKRRRDHYLNVAIKVAFLGGDASAKSTYDCAMEWHKEYEFARFAEYWNKGFEKYGKEATFNSCRIG